MAIKISCGKEGEKITQIDKDIVKSISEEYKEKIERYLKDIISFDLHIKCHHKVGNLKRYEVIARINSPGHYFETSSDEYNLKDASHKTMEKLLGEIIHKTKSDK